MTKKLVLILIAFSTSQLFCAAAEMSAELKEYYRSEDLEDIKEGLSLAFECSNLVEENASKEHALLTREAFPSSAPCPPDYYPNFLTRLRNGMDVLVSARYKVYEQEVYTGRFAVQTRHYNADHLVGGLFGRKLKGPQPLLGIDAKAAFMQLNCIYVKPSVQRRYIGHTTRRSRRVLPCKWNWSAVPNAG
jgi:hypothetical protein